MIRRSTTLPRALLCLVLILAVAIGASPAAGQGRSIDFAAGDTLAIGPSIPQRWVNVIGTVAGAEDDTTAEYRIGDGDWRPLTLGPDERRLVALGDFNADIAVDSLAVGATVVEVRVRWTDGEEQTAAITIDRTAPAATDDLSIDWSDVEGSTGVALPVDGTWSVSDAGVTNGEIAYDRLLAIGDVSWDSYEVTVPVTLDSVDPDPTFPSFGAAVAIFVRWPGHDDWGGAQPASGWHPFGASLNYTWWQDDTVGSFHLEANRLELLEQDHSGATMEPGDTYLFKIRAESVAGHGTIYRGRVWPEGQPEPDDWTLGGVEPVWELQEGGTLLIAHHTGVTFGDLTVTPLDDTPGLFGDSLRYLLFVPALLLLAAAWRATAPDRAPLARAAIIVCGVALVGGTAVRWMIPDALHGREETPNTIGAATVGVHGMTVAVLAIVALGLARRAARPAESAEP